jgi:hypothetical protein
MNIVALTSSRSEIARSMYIAMDVAGLYVIVPASILTVLTGVVQSLGTQWGIWRHRWVATKLVLGILATIALLVCGCDDNPFADWNDRIDPHDKLRARIEEMSGSYAAMDPLSIYTIHDVDIYRVDGMPLSYVWTPGQTFDAEIGWSYVTDPSTAFDVVEAVAYRFANDGWMMVGQPLVPTNQSHSSQTLHFELPADACADISAECLVLPFEQYVVFSREEIEERHGVIQATPPGTVSIKCGRCSGADCKQAPEC